MISGGYNEGKIENNWKLQKRRGETFEVAIEKEKRSM